MISPLSTWLENTKQALFVQYEESRSYLLTYSVEQIRSWEADE